MKILRLSLFMILASSFAMMNAETPKSTLAKTTEEVARVKKSFAPDRRQVIYDVDVRLGQNGRVIVDGVISEQWVADSLATALNRQNIPVDNSIVVYPSDEWAMPRISVVCLRTKPGHASEMASQALMGMPLRVLEVVDDWYHVQTPDGYLSWVTDSSIVPYDSKRMDQWRRADRLVVTAPWQLRAFNSPTANGVRDVVTDLVLGNIVETTGSKSHKRIEIILPDGRKGWVDSNAVTPIEQWASQDFNPELILDVAYSMEGTPYLWGGTSAKTLDCSGLAKTSYLANGIILMRDASQQALTGTRIEAKDWRNCQAGDLLFFGNARTGRVTHVAIYDHDGNYVHSSGRVKRNSVDPQSESYLTTPFLHAVRINGMQGTQGITRAIDHPWYFAK